MCAFCHGIQKFNGSHFDLAPALCTEWLGWVATPCELRHVRTGPNSEVTNVASKDIATSPRLTSNLQHLHRQRSLQFIVRAGQLLQILCWCLSSERWRIGRHFAWHPKWWSPSHFGAPSHPVGRSHKDKPEKSSHCHKGPLITCFIITFEVPYKKVLDALCHKCGQCPMQFVK